MSEMLLERHKKNSFLHRIVDTGMYLFNFHCWRMLQGISGPAYEFEFHFEKS